MCEKRFTPKTFHCANARLVRFLVSNPSHKRLYRADKKSWYVVARNFLLHFFLPGSAWVLLSKICNDFFSALYIARLFVSYGSYPERAVAAAAVHALVLLHLARQALQRWVIRWAIGCVHSSRVVKDHQNFDLDQRSRSLPVI